MALNYNIENFPYNLLASHRVTSKNKNSEFHLHNNYEIYLFLQGDVNYFVEQSVYPLKRGNVLIFNNNEIHGPTFLSDCAYERGVIHFSAKFAESLSTPQTNLLQCFTNRTIGTHNMTTLNENQISDFLNLLNKIIDCQKNTTYGNDVLEAAYLCELLVMVNTLYSTNDVWVKLHPMSDKLKQVLAYINSNIQSEISLEMLAKLFSTDKCYLARLFKKETGSTIYNYILLKRISLAKKLLSEGYNVTEVCMLTGFNDYSNFIRTFKKTTGYPPAKYNKKHS